jgi:serine/threonine protein kinase
MMALPTGTRLGTFEIVSLIGAGGMGEVYRARDSNLNRDVAVKVLLNLSTDPQRLHRFEQEARAAGSINHPNILAVYHMGTYEGAPYLVSELLEGETLRAIVKRGPLPLRKVIDYGVQIAHGLQAAHEKGIVHRDLKPENVFLTRDGRIKILDFGLAKLTQPEGSEFGAMTVTSATEPGVVMGTVGYMSPEQVRGERVDLRTDIFAFGAMLYEMLTGKPAFQQATATESMTAILRDDPPDILDLVPSLPMGIQRVLHRCIEKIPEQRFHSAADLAFALSSAADSALSGPRPALVIPPASSGGKKWLAPLILLVVVVLGAPAAFFLLGPKLRRSNVVTPAKTEDGSKASLPAKSEDNLKVATAKPPEAEVKVSQPVAPPGGPPAVVPRELSIPDAAAYTWFDPDSKQALVWYSSATPGNYRFFDGPGTDPQNGHVLNPVTPEFVDGLKKQQAPPVVAPPPVITPPASAPKQKTQITATAPKSKEKQVHDSAANRAQQDARLQGMAQDGQLALENEDYQKAIDICGQVLSASAGSEPCASIHRHAAIKLAEQLVNKAAADWEKGDFDDALRNSETALVLDPANKNAARLKKLALKMKPQTSQ